MENLRNNKKEGMNEGEKKLGTNWDLVTCRYGVRLENHAPYHDWVCLPLFFIVILFFPNPLPLWPLTFIWLLSRQDLLQWSGIPTYKIDKLIRFRGLLLPSWREKGRGFVGVLTVLIPVSSLAITIIVRCWPSKCYLASQASLFFAYHFASQVSYFHRWKNSKFITTVYQ